MPGWLAREQYKADSSRARYWFGLTKDSTYIRKYLRKGSPAAPAKKDSSAPKTRIAYLHKWEATEPKTIIYPKTKTTA